MDAFPVYRRFTRYFRGHVLIMATLYHNFCQVNTHCLNSFHGKSQFSVANCLISRGYLRYTEMISMKIPWKSNETSIFNRKIPSKAPISATVVMVKSPCFSSHCRRCRNRVLRAHGAAGDWHCALQWVRHRDLTGKNHNDELQDLEWWGYWQLFYQW